MIPPLRALSRGVAVTTALALLATGCGDGSNDSDEATGPLDQVTYLTGFGTFGREAPAYVADAKGYFADEGIEVDIQPGAGTLANITQTVEGEADFALGDLTGALLAYGADELPPGYTAVAAIQQQTVFAIITLDGQGITSPQDLEGKTIGDGAASFGPLLFPTYAELAGFDDSKVEYDASFEPPVLPGMLAGGQVDAIGQFVMGKPTIEAAAEGRTAVVLPFSDVLRDLYGNVLWTDDGTDPDLVRRFIRALMRGMEDAAANPAAAGRILARAVPEVDPEVAAAELVLMKPYIYPLKPGAPIGSIDDQRVSKSIAVLESAGAIPEGVTPEDVVDFELVPGADE